jgi:hypothetical protein
VVRKATGTADSRGEETGLEASLAAAEKKQGLRKEVHLHMPHI